MVNQSLANMRGMRKDNIQALKLLILPTAFLLCMLVTLDTRFYLLGQLTGALFFMQAFILLHECGHRSLFKQAGMNQLVGTIVSILVFIPYRNWREIHDLHHKWAGIRDKDPTTEDTFADQLSDSQKKIINIAWKFYLPLFTLGYRIGTYWNTTKLKKHLAPAAYQKCLRWMLVYILFYVVTFIIAYDFILSILPALLLSWVLCDILTLSQHAHIEMMHSQGRDLAPFKYADQLIYSRSLVFPHWFGRFILLNFNYHEFHHAYPGLPCYYLDQLQLGTHNSYQFVPWLKRVKAMAGVDFIFRTSQNRDF